MSVIQAIKDGVIGVVGGLLLFATIVMIASPFLNWMLGHGFRWIF